MLYECVFVYVYVCAQSDSTFCLTNKIKFSLKRAKTNTLEERQKREKQTHTFTQQHNQKAESLNGHSFRLQLLYAFVRLNMNVFGGNEEMT